MSRGFLVEREYPGRDVVEEPVDAAEEVLAGDGAAPHDAPVVRLDAVQLQHLEKGCKINLDKELCLRSARWRVPNSQIKL